MNLTHQFRKYYFHGEWHIHTNFTDGENTVDEYCQEAERAKIPLLAFTEHVRYNLSYKFDDLLNDIDKAKEKYKHLIILSGCEAKVLPGGKLDCKEEIIKKCDYVIFAFHSFPADLKLYFESLNFVINNYQVHTWAHPGLFFKKLDMQFFPDNFQEVFKTLKEKKINIEINYKYSLPSLKWLEQYKKTEGNNNFIFGGDIHNIKQFKEINNLKLQQKISYQKANIKNQDICDFIIGSFNNTYNESM